MATIDLHAHTTVSDGGLTPTEVVVLAAQRGVTVLAITDHDTVEGIPEAREAGEREGVEIVPGVELNTDIESHVGDGPDHADILGYFVDITDVAFRVLLADILAARESRARTMVERLQHLGVPIAWDEVAALSVSGAVGRPHVARALVADGAVPDVETAFARYLSRGRPAFADRYRLTTVDACRAIRAASGVPVVAHPVSPRDPWRDPLRLRRFLPDLVAAGLGGLECYYPGYTPRVIRWLEALAYHFKLVPTGGSDFHGPWRDDRQLGQVDVPPETLDRLRAAAGVH